MDTEDTDNQSDRSSLGQSTVHTEGTGNHPTGGGWAQTTRQTGGTHSGAVSTVRTEGTDNQSDRSYPLGHTGAVNCTFRGHRQPVRQGAHWDRQLYIQRAQTTIQTGGPQQGTLGKILFWTLTIVLPPRNNSETKLFTSLPLIDPSARRPQSIDQGCVQGTSQS